MQTLIGPQRHTNEQSRQIQILPLLTHIHKLKRKHGSCRSLAEDSNVLT